ncbi:hypothetical protein SAMN05920897_10863 [Alkalispirochaeta americana]|uniref:Alcohol acetyltransferase n=1 Tax=Alkalispirochaeta americana TaxID=159291 RepID=A0A1N6SFS5_9SPIO|nr:hypothetical protein [Alkalispirochaeta americana]SIQ39877.1 hypothetical protein SAMN05920897_10863 [Alkalispirochaeta americana]
MISFGAARGEHSLRWYPLDTTAIIFPPALSSRFTTVFRISARLEEPVDLASLEQATAALYRRAPYFCVRLRQGLFWYYLEECPPAGVLRDDGFPCMDFPKRGGARPLIVVRARGCRIAVEVSHVLTDGRGALLFLRTLLEMYSAVLRGEPFDGASQLDSERSGEDRHPPGVGDILRPGEPESWETRYASRLFYRPGQPHPPSYSLAWHVPGPLLARGRYRVTTGRYPLERVKEIARGMGVSVTDLFLALFMYAFQICYHREHQPRRHRRPLRILVPVDMRPGTGLRTMRNFFVYAMVELDQRLGVYQVDEIARNVHHQLRAQLDPRSLRKQVARNVAARKNWFNRSIPVFLKDLILRGVYRFQGEAVNTASFSNLGEVSLSRETAGKVLDFDFLPPPSAVTGPNMTLVSFRGIVSVSFGSLRRDPVVERSFFQTLASLGIQGDLITN